MIKTDKEIILIKRACYVLSKLLVFLKRIIRPGITTNYLDKIATSFILNNNCLSSFLNYNNFPKSICISINNELIHGIPSDYVLKGTDMISIDAGCKYNGYHSDAAFSKIVDDKIATKKQLRIIHVTNKALNLAIQKARENINLKEVSRVIEQYLTKKGYYIPIEYCGHGIGKNLHEDPYVGNLECQSDDIKLKANMVLAIEPMVIENSCKIFIKKDKWTIHTGSNISCHFEKTILVKKNSCEILTNY